MKRFVLVAGLLAATPALALLDQSAPGIVKQSGQFVSAGAGQMGLTVASATALTVPANAVLAQICVETAPVRYRDDGTAPTSTVGMLMAAGTCMAYAGPLSAVQFIAASGSPTLDVLYYK